jgi:hypothetical protein
MKETLKNTGVKKKRGGAIPGAGRKPKTFDWPEVGRMCKIQCTHEEIASILGTTKDTLYDACKRDLKVDFSTYYRQKADGGKKCLRRRQWSEAVDDGNVTMMIWLGKQHLGQSDKLEASGKDGGPLVGVVNVFFGDESKHGKDTEG